jgi:hypothetical protein
MPRCFRTTCHCQRCSQGTLQAQGSLRARGASTGKLTRKASANSEHNPQPPSPSTQVARRLACSLHSSHLAASTATGVSTLTAHHALGCAPWEPGALPQTRDAVDDMTQHTLSPLEPPGHRASTEELMHFVRHQLDLLAGQQVLQQLVSLEGESNRLQGGACPPHTHASHACHAPPAGRCLFHRGNATVQRLRFQRHACRYCGAVGTRLAPVGTCLATVECTLCPSTASHMGVGAAGSPTSVHARCFGWSCHACGAALWMPHHAMHSCFPEASQEANGKAAARARRFHASQAAA